MYSGLVLPRAVRLTKVVNPLTVTLHFGKFIKNARKGGGREGWRAGWGGVERQGVHCTMMNNKACHTVGRSEPGECAGDYTPHLA